MIAMPFAAATSAGLVLSAKLVPEMVSVALVIGFFSLLPVCHVVQGLELANDQDSD